MKGIANPLRIQYGTTDIVYLVYGLRRSGIHAISYWLMHQFPKPFWVVDGTIAPLQKLKTCNYFGGATDCTHFPAGIVVFEDCEVNDIRRNIPGIKRLGCCGKVGKFKSLMIIREPLNWIASRLKKKNKEKGKLRITKEHVEQWKDYLKLITSHDIYGIFFDKWFKSEEYRRQLSKDLGLEFDDTMLNFIPPEGGGSSFDGDMFQGRAQEMKICDRGQHYQDDPNFWELADEEIKKLSGEWFNG